MESTIQGTDELARERLVTLFADPQLAASCPPVPLPRPVPLAALAGLGVPVARASAAGTGPGRLGLQPLMPAVGRPRPVPAVLLPVAVARVGRVGGWVVCGVACCPPHTIAWRRIAVLRLHG